MPFGNLLILAIQWVCLKANASGSQFRVVALQHIAGAIALAQVSEDVKVSVRRLMHERRQIADLRLADLVAAIRQHAEPAPRLTFTGGRLQQRSIVLACVRRLDYDWLIPAIASGVGRQGGSNVAEILRGGILPHRDRSEFFLPGPSLFQIKSSAVSTIGNTWNQELEAVLRATALEACGAGLSIRE